MTLDARVQSALSWLNAHVNMALRAIGKRNRALHAAAVAVARRLAGSENATAKWVGKDALRELTSPGVKKRVASKGA